MAPDARPLDELDRAEITQLRDDLAAHAHPTNLCGRYARLLSGHLRQPYLSAYPLVSRLAGMRSELRSAQDAPGWDAVLARLTGLPSTSNRQAA